MLLCVAYARVADDNNGYRIEGRIILDGTSLKSSEVKVILDGGEHVAPLRTNGVFAFSDVPSGTHLLEVIALGHVFRAVRLDVTQGAVHAYTADSMQLALPYPLRLKASAQVYYFEKYSSFSYMSLLKNPMVLMGLGLVVIMMLPKLVVTFPGGPKPPYLS
eukprot:jgi/Mesvir1/26244/Mv05722-RA.1